MKLPMLRETSAKCKDRDCRVMCQLPMTKEIGRAL